MRSICVFCGSQVGNNPRYANAAKNLGALLVKNNIKLIFGGGGIGLMGILADAVMAHGGKAIGVIPRFLSDRELGHTQLSELIMVESMHQRKQKMAELADGFLALPGGFGTLEELCEILTWRQLKLVEKPIGILNIGGFFNHLDFLLDHMIEEGFLTKGHKNLLLIEEDPMILINSFLRFSPGVSQDIDKT
jgi:uncharacterized protein (TIGR00730 family)